MNSEEEALRRRLMQKGVLMGQCPYCGVVWKEAYEPARGAPWAYCPDHRGNRYRVKAYGDRRQLQQLRGTGQCESPGCRSAHVVDVEGVRRCSRHLFDPGEQVTGHGNGHTLTFLDAIFPGLEQAAHEQADPEIRPITARA